MNTNITLTIFICLFSIQLFSQNQNSFKYAFNAGLNSAKTKIAGPDGSEFSESLTLPEIGISAFSSLQDKTFIQTGIVFSGKGGQYSAFGEYEKSSIYYLEVPFYYGYRMRIPNMNNINVSLFGGGQAGYALFGKSKSKYAGDPEDVYDLFSGDASSQPKRFNIGIGLGINFELNQKYIFTLKRTNSLMSIEKDSGDYKDRFKNFTISFSYVF